MPLLIIALIILAVLAAIIWNISVYSQMPKRKSLELLPEVPFEVVSWTNAGETIIGWFIPPPLQSNSNGAADSATDSQTSTSTAPAIVIAHGWSSNRASMLRYVSSFHEEGYALLLYDARGHGESGAVRAASGLTMRDDLRAAIDYLCNRPEIDRKRIGVVGHSLGAFGAVLALGSGERRIKALVTDSMPAQLSTMVTAELTRKKLPLFPLVQLIPLVIGLRSGVPRSHYDPILAIEQSVAPILMVHSRGDDFIPWTELDYMLKRIKRKVDNLYLTNEGHSTAATEDEFWNYTLSFFDKHLAPAPSSNSFPTADQYEI
jgi:dipeptidyl aminopeptidase/acylaminoacyl peptidase